MSKVMHIRDVPDEVHDALVEAASARGLSLARYLQRELEHIAHRGQVVQGFTELTLTRFPADWLRPRMWALRHNLNAYDATYVALTELTDATALLTTDAQLAKAPGPECTIELLS